YYQAEDGIRYFHVTGVQTCALPILNLYQQPPKNNKIMNKKLIIFCLHLITTLHLNSQTTSFDNLNANIYTNKAITWTSSNYGSGFGHRIINTDPGGQTLLNFQARHNTTTWSDLLTLTTLGRVRSEEHTSEL